MISWCRSSTQEISWGHDTPLAVCDIDDPGQCHIWNLLDRLGMTLWTTSLKIGPVIWLLAGIALEASLLRTFWRGTVSQRAVAASYCAGHRVIASSRHRPFIPVIVMRSFWQWNDERGLNPFAKWYGCAVKSRTRRSKDTTFSMGSNGIVAGWSAFSR
jgi:hypothetical protein